MTDEQRRRKNEYRNRWRREHPKLVRAQEKRHRLKHRDKFLAGLRRNYQRHRKEYLSRAAAFRKANPDAMRDFHLRKKYGLSLAEHSRLSAEQSGVCAICLEPEVLILRGRRILLSVDHDHRTGKVRGLLCSACNFAVGKVRENSIIARRLADYLERHQESERKMV